VVAVRWQGQSFAVDRLIVGIGAEPEVELARAAGLACDNGIAVDANLATGDPHIFAIGDCTSFPFSGARVRLESVQNANDQARALAQRLSGKDAAYQPVPTFWSDQGEARLQIAGLWQPAFDAVLRPGARAGSFSVFHYDGPSLRAVESINAPMDHLAAKGWLQRGHSPAREAVADTARPLKSL
jgi:3-phenylpropionate/trans-cinnamate dioxygenase ferredoxin reductase subunit